MNTLNDKKFFEILLKQDFLLEIEDRVELGYRTYGIDNHAEFINYMNPHDKCLWDAIIPGYSKKLKGGVKYKTTDILGIFYLKNGNHKIAVKINEPGYNSCKSKRDLILYMKTYNKFVPVYGEWIGLTKSI